MRQRTTSTIDIMRVVSGEPTIVLTVPITAQSRRKFTLMSEDYISLAFVTGLPTELRIGDYIDDEVFGLFYLNKGYTPRYNTTTGGYEYEPHFVAPYMMWANWLHCLIADDSEAVTRRMESKWSLTDQLSKHITQITANLSVLGLGVWNYSITAENALKSLYIAYNGISILDALNAIADAYECEWWVTTEDNTIHFGKCEGSNEPLTFALGVNVESMDIRDDRTKFANRLYVYGGSKNIPIDYDRNLVFTASGVSGGKYKDDFRPITIDMLGGKAQTNLTFGSASISSNTATIATGSVTLNNGGIIEGEIDVNATLNMMAVYYTLRVVITQTGSELRTIHTESGVVSHQLRKTIQIAESVGSGSTYQVKLIVTAQQGATITNLTAQSTLKGVANAQTVSANIIYGGNTYAVAFAGDYSDMYFTFPNGAPSGFGDYEQYTINGLLSEQVPSWYYTDNYINGTLTTIGERRLHLPLNDYPNRYIDFGSLDNQFGIVEEAIVFEDVFPRLELMITSVREEPYQQKVINEDGSTTYQNAIRYYFQVEKRGGGAFVFNTKYLLDGEKLQGEFYAPDDVQTGNLLAGMTFDLGFDNATQEYRIVRNEDYGVMLPNNILHPQQGDFLTLTGWNPKAIDNLGLVDDAETTLRDKGEEYVSAIQQGNYTFGCTIISDYLQSIAEVGEDYDLPREGSRVRIINNALPNGEYNSRVIGYEVKLDMPYDSPKITVGETQAYSRLAKIEKEITKLK